MTTNTTGRYCVAVGQATLHVQTTGNYNTAVGYIAGYDLTTASQCTLLGYIAGSNITTGDANTCLGHSTATNLTTGHNNTFVGRENTASSASTTYETVVASQQTGKGTETFLAGGGNGAYNQANNSAWSTTSDRRIKKNITNNTTGLDKINQITVRNFEYKTEDEIKTDNPELTDVVKAAAVDQQGLQLGVIAQEIEGVLPEVVKTQSTGVKAVNPDNLTWYLINAVKELSAKVEELESKLNN